MDSQILQAVEIALSGTADAALKQQAYDFIEQIKTTQEGYTSCVDILVKQGNTLNEQFKFFIYQVIEENIQQLSADELYKLSDTLFECLKREDENTPVYLKNKLAGTLGNLFCFVYLEVRPSFLKDLLSMSEESSLLTDYYTRIILAIHSEIGDKFISRSREVQERNVNLKDKIRVTDMASLVANWKSILNAGATKDTSDAASTATTSDVLNNTLKIVGSYIEWMDITLFVSEPAFINCIFQYLTKPYQRITTCSTLIEIISKKMQPANKLELLSLLSLTLVINSILQGDDDDLEFAESIAKLVNQIGLELIIVLEGNPSLEGGEINRQIINLWPFIFNFLGHEYDDVTQQVFPFISQYLLACKKFQSIVSIELLSNLLNKIIIKMKYDDDTDGRDEDEDNEEFIEIRSKLKNFQDTIAVLKPDLYLEAIPVVINELLKEEGNNDWRRIELGLYELGNFADSLRNNLINLPKHTISSSEPFLLFQNFLVKLVNSNFIINIDHPKIQLEFFELIVRHYSFLNNNQDLTLRTLEIFTSPLGLFNQLEKVRLRSWYLFFRFVKLTKPRLSKSEANFIENTLKKVQPLLVIKAILPTNDEDGAVVVEDIFNNQLYLFETMGLLISLGSSEVDLKLKLIDMIFQPLFRNLEECVEASQAGGALNMNLIALQAHHLLMAIGTFARGYDYDYNNKYSQEIVSKIDTAASIVIFTLLNFVKFEKIRDASRFAFARFIPILGKDINNHLSKLVSLILSSNDLKYNELTDFLGFLGQIVHKFKADNNIYQLLNDLILPLFDKIFNMLKFNGENNDFDSIPDIQRDKNSLKKLFMNLLSTIILNHNSSLLVSQTNKQKFPQVVDSLFEFAYDLSDPTVSRAAIIQLVNFILIMGKGRIEDPEDSMGTALPPIEGMEDYLMNKSISVCFELPFQNGGGFDIKDAQFRIIAQEIATLLKTYHKVKGDEFLSVLSTYLTNMGLSQELMNDFGTNLVKLDQREFKKYFISFVTQLKG